MRSIMKQVTILLLTLLLFPFHDSSAQNKRNDYPKVVDPNDVTIVRDQWGVAHIYGKTDADAAYGLAWATAEDDFEAMQTTFMVSKAMLGRKHGKEGAIIDYVNHLLRLDDLVNEKYEKDLSPAFRNYMQAYCQGVNDYASTHKKEVELKGLFPITPKELLKGYALSIGLMTGVKDGLENIFEGRVDDTEVDIDFGSNAFAFSKKKTTDGKTYLIVNAHQPITGPMAFYEAHMVSEEGLNIHGGTFPGAATILHGVNENLGWAHTTNGFDKIDVYELEMNPENENQYKFDDEWLDLEVRKVKLKVKILGIKIPVKQKTYWSKYGATLKTDNGVYSIRMLANMDVRFAEQWYKMGKATNYNEFMDALHMQAIPMQNITYADKEDNIMFINHGVMPVRNPKYNWQKVLPGNTSETLWTEIEPLEAHPQVINPDCGYVFNTNQTPFTCTCPEENPKPEDYPSTGGYRMLDNNRSLRVRELYDGKAKMSMERLKEIKYDLQFPEESVFLNTFIYRMFDLDTNKYPHLAKAIAKGKAWNRRMDKENEVAPLVYFATGYVFELRNVLTTGFRKDLELSEDELVAALEFGQNFLLKHFGTIDVKYGNILRHRRGNKDFAFQGFPDVMGSMMSDEDEPHKDGTFTANHGEDLIMFIKFTEAGPEFSTIDAYGVSNKPDSPHYNDQMEMYLKGQSKPMSLNKSQVMANAKSVYHPGLAENVDLREDTNTAKDK